MSKSLILAVEEVKIRDAILLTQSLWNAGEGGGYKDGYFLMQTGVVHEGEAAMWSCEVCHVHRLSLGDFSWNLSSWLKDLFVFHTSCSPACGNINKPSPEEVPYFDHSFMLPKSLSWADPASDFSFHTESLILALLFPISVLHWDLK